jgi:hypothetical protein
VTRRLVATVVAMLALVGCAGPGATPAPASAPPLGTGEFAIPTIAPPLGSTLETCPAALITGELDQLSDGSLGLDAAGESIRVRWPFGWRGTSGPPVGLVDQDGAVVAITGQVVEVGGGMVADGWWLGCGGVTVLD